jgi:hypothetical protein
MAKKKSAISDWEETILSYDEPPPPRSRSEVVAEIRATREKPRRFQGELIPPHVHEFYKQLWRQEDIELKAIEKWKRDHSWRAILGRLVGIRG